MKSLALSLLLAASACAGEINLVAEVRTFFEEGGEFKRLKFAGKTEDHHLTLDSELSIEKLADGTRFTFQKISTAIFELRPSPVSRDRPIAADFLGDYRKAALAQLPAGATLAGQGEEVPDPHPINGWKTHRYLLDYTLNDSQFRIAVTFLTLAEGPQILLTTRATKEQFANAIARSDDLLRSWFTVAHGGEKNKGGS